MNTRPLPPPDSSRYLVDDISPVEDGSTQYERLGAVWDAYDCGDLEVDVLHREIARRGVKFKGEFKRGLWAVAAERDGLVGVGAGVTLEAALIQLIESIDEQDARIPAPPRVPAEARDYIPTDAPRGEA